MILKEWKYGEYYIYAGIGSQLVIALLSAL